MEVDEALSQLGTRIGLWHVLYFTMLSAACMFPSCFHMYAINYIGGQPKSYHCRVPDGTSADDVIPRNDKGEFVKCEMFVNRDTNETTKCTEWEYFGDIGHTIVSQWDLVCDREYLKALSQTVLIVGVMFGAMGFTTLSDYFGRKPVFLFSQCAMVVVGVINAFVPDFYAFIVLRFCTGALQQGIILIGFVMACELFASKHRTFAGIIIQDFWAVATCMLALLAYLIRHWVYLQLVISLLGLLTIPLFWLLPESVVWLYANNRVDEAERIIRNAAKLNNVEMPDNILTRKSTELDETTAGEGSGGEDGEAKNKKNGGNVFVKFSNLARLRKRQKEESTAVRYTLLDVFRNLRLALYCVCMSFLWMVITLVYYGLSLSAGELAGNRYLNNFISGAVEIPAYTISFFILGRWGRRRPLIAFNVVAGVALLLSQVFPKTTADGISLIPLRMTFNMIGKFGITGSFGIVFLYTPEIFPTTLRSRAIGIASLTGRIGNMIAPFTDYVTRIVPWLPGLLFGGLAVGSGMLTFFLPETLNRPLPQTIEDIENWYKKPKRQTQQHEMSAVHGIDSVGGNEPAGNAM